MAIRYNQKLNTNINRIVRNYNAKIKRLERSEEELYLPDLTSVKEIKEGAKNRRELNRMLKDLERFSERGMEKTVTFASGVEMSRYQAEKLKRNIRIAKAKTTRQINEFKSTPIKVFGIPQNTPYQYDEAYLNLKTQRENLEKNIYQMNRKQIERLESNLEDIIYSYEMEEQYKDNWIDMIEKLSYYGEVDKHKVDEIKERIKNISPSNFTKLYRNEKSIKALQELYRDVVRNKLNVDEELASDIDDAMSNFYSNIGIILKDYE